MAGAVTVAGTLAGTLAGALPVPVSGAAEWGLAKPGLELLRQRQHLCQRECPGRVPDAYR